MSTPTAPSLLTPVAAHPPLLCGATGSHVGAFCGIAREPDVRCEDFSPIDAKALRLQVRDEQSRPIVNAIGEAAARVKPFNGSPMAKAP